MFEIYKQLGGSAVVPSEVIGDNSPVDADSSISSFLCSLATIDGTEAIATSYEPFGAVKEATLVDASNDADAVDGRDSPELSAEFEIDKIFKNNLYKYPILGKDEALILDP
uniref:Uncharacterized protein n=1 Tax=Glossina pallidipes TaxID=7398 RepID=A0A1A9Z0K0_GLOPL